MRAKALSPKGGKMEEINLNPPIPYIVGVKTNKNAYIVVENERTKEKVILEPNSYGEHIVYLNHLRKGYKDKDKITISAITKQVVEKEVNMKKGRTIVNIAF